MRKKPYHLSKRVTILEMEISDGYLDAVKNLGEQARDIR